MRTILIRLILLVALALSGCAVDDTGGVGLLIADDRASLGGGYPASVAASADSVAWGEARVVHTALGGDAPYTLDTGDKLRIFVYGQPNLSRLYIVDPAGMLTVPLIGGVKARGLTTFALERKIRDKLGATFVKDPQVTVDIQQMRPFFILGEVKTAGQYPFVPSMTVEAAVAIGGGYTERANHRGFRVTRRGEAESTTFEAPPDFPLEPGDTVFVHERLF
jgi:polysaccharide export outer membrane protein